MTLKKMAALLLLEAPLQEQNFCSFSLKKPEKPHLPEILMTVTGYSGSDTRHGDANQIRTSSPPSPLRPAHLRKYPPERREREHYLLPGSLLRDKTHLLDLFEVVEQAAPLLCQHVRDLPGPGVCLQDEVLEGAAALCDGPEELGLVLAGELDRDGGQLDDLLDADLAVLLVVPGDGRDHRGLGEAAGDVGGNRVGAQRAAHVEDAPAAVLLLREDDVDDLGGSVHDVALVHLRDGDLVHGGEVGLHAGGDLPGDALAGGIVVPDDEDDAGDRVFPVLGDRFNQPFPVVADEDDVGIGHYTLSYFSLRNKIFYVTINFFNFSSHPQKVFRGLWEQKIHAEGTWCIAKIVNYFS